MTLTAARRRLLHELLEELRDDPRTGGSDRYHIGFVAGVNVRQAAEDAVDGEEPIVGVPV